MPSTGRVRAYLGCSIDGFIAGLDDDLSWLSAEDAQTAPDSTAAGAIDFHHFLKDVGTILMGRRTYDVAVTFNGPWPYDDIPILVASNRDIPPTAAPVRSAQGHIADLVREALEEAGGKDVYIDGGAIIRQALDAELLDEAILTIAPVILGRGIPLFLGCEKRHQLTIASCTNYGNNMAQLLLRLTPERT